MAARRRRQPGFVAGQLPTSQFLGPYLPAVIGAITCLAAVLGFLRVWTPAAAARRESDVHSRAPRENRRRELRWPRAGIVPIGVLVAVVMAWTGPWSPLPRYVPLKLSVAARGSLDAPVVVTFSWAPFVAGTATLTAWC